MTRRWPLLLLLAALAGCQSADNSEPPAPLTGIEDALSLRVNWRVDTRAADNEAAYRLRPLLIGDRLYSIDTRGTILCIDAQRGRRLWRHDSGLAAVTGLGGSEDLLIGSSRDGDVVAWRLREDGLDQRWKTRVGSEIRATPVIDGGQVIIRGGDGSLHSLAAGDGREQWKRQQRVPSLSLTGASSPLVDGDTVYAGFDDGKLLALDRLNGEVRWEATIGRAQGRTEIERLVDIDGDILLRDGILFVASYQGRRAAVQAVCGDLLWSREFSGYQPMAIDAEALYLADEFGDLWSVDRRTGSAYWKQDALHARGLTAPALLGDHLAVADFEGYLHWIDKSDGRLRGRVLARVPVD